MEYENQIYRSVSEIPAPLRDMTITEHMMRGCMMKMSMSSLPSARQVLEMPLDEQILCSDLVCRVAPFTIDGFCAEQIEMIRNTKLDLNCNGTAIGCLALLSEIAPDPEHRQVFKETLVQLEALAAGEKSWVYRLAKRVKLFGYLIV